MKKTLAAILAIFFVFAVGQAEASLTTIGSASYLGHSYNLIYDNDSPFGSIVYLDYTKGYAAQSVQISWAANLNVGIFLKPGYSVQWSGGWRLPKTTDADSSVGYYKTNSELGHLYYTELGNKGKYDINNNLQTGYGLNNLGPFTSLVSPAWYGTSTNWSGYPYDGAYLFNTLTGESNRGPKANSLLAIAVRPGVVTQTPIPAAAWLLGSGLLGLLGFKRKFNK